jgi:hypothetical protein
LRHEFTGAKILTGSQHERRSEPTESPRKSKNRKMKRRNEQDFQMKNQNALPIPLIFFALQYVGIKHFREDCQGNVCQRNGKKSLQFIPLTIIPLTLPAFHLPCFRCGFAALGLFAAASLYSILCGPPGNLMA